MCSEHFSNKLTLEEYTALVRDAKARAQVLRREASVAFWHAVERGLRNAAYAVVKRLWGTRIEQLEA